MKFKDASSVNEVLWQMWEMEYPRAQNRTRIDALFNGNPPYTLNEQTENRIETNTNFLEGPKILQDARATWTNAYLKKGNYFTVNLDSGPAHKKREWSHIITRNINRPMKRSLQYTECLRNIFAQLCLHGVGPVEWQKKRSWLPTMIGIEDLFVPTNTRLDLGNLDHFAIYRRYTAAELYKWTHGPNVDPGWNKPMVNAILNILAKQPYQASTAWADWRFPEKIEESFKENSGYYMADMSPTFNCFTFMFWSEEEGGWVKTVVADTQNPFSSIPDAVGGPFKNDSKAQFVYRSKKAYAQKLDHFLHIQFADGANVAPFRYHTVRSLGYMLYSVCHLMNRLRCKFTDHLFESLLWIFRITSEEDRERIQMVQLQNMGVIPDELKFVTAQERYQVPSDLINAGFSQIRQLMSENSSSFTQDVNDGTNKELTATEVMTRVNSASQMVGSMLNLSYVYMEQQWREIARRFCMKDSDDPDVKAFQRRCKSEGVDPSALDVEKWDIEAERVLGAGNKMLEIAQADKLMGIRPLLDPDSQREIDHIFVEANTDDPKLAERLVPMQKRSVSDSVMLASSVIGSLMQGFPVPVKQGINHIDYVNMLLGYMQTEIDKINQSGGVANEQQLNGLITTRDHVAQHVQIISQNPNEKERVKEYSDAISSMDNEIRAYAQRLQEQQAASGDQPNPELDAKIKAITTTAESKARIAEANAAQKRIHKQLSFEQKQAMDEAKTQTAIATQDIEAQANIIRENAAAMQKPKPQPSKSK